MNKEVYNFEWTQVIKQIFLVPKIMQWGLHILIII